MIAFTLGEEFLVAVQRPYIQHEQIEAHGLTGRIVEPISYMDYVEVWAYRGFPSEAISDSPRFYYRCKLVERLAARAAPVIEMPVRGDQKSA